MRDRRLAVRKIPAEHPLKACERIFENRLPQRPKGKIFFCASNIKLEQENASFPNLLCRVENNL